MVKVAVGVMGGNPFFMTKGMAGEEQMKQFLAVCKAHNVPELDTARIYGASASEQMLGELKATSDFRVSTKILTAQPTNGTLQREKVLESAKASLQALQVDKVDILYLHQPDAETPFDETLKAIDELHRQGVFVRFGICHYSADQVREIHSICKQNNYVLPTVYQGNYNALMRTLEGPLLTALRELGIAFYGFGATAGGTLAKPIEEILSPAEDSRWATLPIVKKAYGSTSTLDVVKGLHQSCKEADIPIGEAAIRWTKHHSALGDRDTILLGASSERQLQFNLDAFDKGPLPEGLASAFSSAYPSIQAASA